MAKHPVIEGSLLMAQPHFEGVSRLRVFGAFRFINPFPFVDSIRPANLRESKGPWQDGRQAERQEFPMGSRTADFLSHDRLGIVQSQITWGWGQGLE